MKKFYGLIIMLVLLSGIKAYAYDDNDFQIWNTDVEEFKISDTSKIALEEEFRWADDANEFFYHHYDAGVTYNMKEYLNIGTGYRHIYELKRGKFKIESAPYINAALLGSLKGFKLEDRSRMEYRHFDYQADSWRYRNKFTVKLPCKFTKMQIQPYLSDETLFSLGGTKQFNQNRFSSGLGMNLIENVKAEIYYMLQDTKNSSGKWIDSNVLGVKFKMAF